MTETRKDAAECGAVIITGAAGGMGLPSARRFAAEGRRLILCDLHEAALARLSEELAPSGARIETLAGDMSAKGFPERLLDLLGGDAIGALVHTAGLSPTMADAARILEVNLFATDRLVSALRPHVAKGGCFVLISSCSAYMVPRGAFDALLKGWLETREPAPLLAAAASPAQGYPLSKQGVIALVANQAAAFGQHGARIVSIAPGFIDTSMGRAEMETSERMVQLIEMTPLQRLGLGDEIASIARMLCSADASYVTGCDVRVDGGIIGALGM
jgi:NAD(P)-dependent dehydrogenase (short-subunit alcohol dehydrogenase family)